MKLPTSLSIITILILFIATYWNVPNIFFIQDEWLEFGLLISQGASIILRGLGSQSVYHLIPIDNLLNFLMFIFFGLNFKAFNIVGLIFHLINALLVWQVAFVLSKNRVAAVWASLLFLSSSSVYQLVMWPLVSLNIISLSFVLLSWISAWNLTQSWKWYYAVSVAVFVLAALLTLEYSIGLVLFIPLVIYLNQRRGPSLGWWKMLFPFAIAVTCYVLLRIAPLLFVGHQSPVTATLLQGPTFTEKFLTYVPRYIAQAMVPERVTWFLVNIIERFTFYGGDIAAKWINFGFGVGLILAIWFLLKTTFERFSRVTLNVWIMLLFISTSVLPFLFIPGAAGQFSLFPPRYLYYGLAGSSLLISYLWSALPEQHKWLKRFFLISMVSWIGLGVLLNWNYQNKLVAQGKLRLDILEQIKTDYPRLPQKTVFFTSSNKSYYGLTSDNKTMPFQSGFGQTLLVWYYPSEGFSKLFYDQRFLWEIKEEGYQEHEGRGLGYFRDKVKLMEALKQNNLSPENVIAYSWDGYGNVLKDISLEVRQELKKDLNGT